MSKICKFCWEANEDSELRCSACGKSLNEAPEKTDYDRLREKLKKQQSENISRTAEEHTSLSPQTSANNKTLIYIVIAAVIVFLFFTYFTKPKNDDNKNINNINNFQESQTQGGFNPNVNFKYSDNPFFEKR